MSPPSKALLFAMLALTLTGACPRLRPSPRAVEALPEVIDVTPGQAIDDAGRKKLLEGLKQADADGPKASERQKRVLRWTLTFATKDGEDYLNQLAALQAILAVPEKDGEETKYRVLRDLKKLPAKGEIEDLREIKRIFWVDDRAASVQPLARALGLKNEPAHIVAFFPEELEKELLQKELKFKGLKEDQITQTRFRVMKRGDKYAPFVIDQTEKK